MKNALMGGAVSGLALIAGIEGALALDGQDFGNKLAAVFSSSGMEVSFDSATAEGDTVTLSGVNFTHPEDQQSQSFPGSMVFTGVAETGDGGYTADQGTADNIEITAEGSDLSIQNMVIEDLTVPAEPLVDARETLTFYRRFAVGPISATYEGTQAFTLEKFETVSTPNDDFTELDSSYTMTGLSFDTSAIEMPEAQPIIAQFGLETVNAEARGSAHWMLDSGAFTLEESSITVDKVGRLNITGAITGYDLALYEQVQANQRALAEMDEADFAARQAAGEELMNALVEAISLKNASLRFDDDGITNKVLDFVAEQQGAPREVVVGGLTAAVPAMLAQSGAPQDFQTMIVQAVQTYLSDPQSFEITLSPAEPVAATALEDALDQDSPAQAIELVNPQVSANQ